MMKKKEINIMKIKIIKFNNQSSVRIPPPKKTKHTLTIF